MKRLIIFVIGIMIVGALNAQSKNDYQYVHNLYGGLTLGGTWNTNPALRTPNTVKLTNWTLSGTQISLFNGATQYGIAVPAADQIDLNAVYVKLTPDTTHVTDDTYTVQSTDAGKVVVFENNFTLVTIDTYANEAIPVNSFVTFVNIGGVVKFTGTNVNAELDSLCIDNPFGLAQLWKRGQNNNVLFGSLK